MQSQEELISIIVPVYQVVKYIGKCIDSILNQSYKNIEVLLIDDASTDGSAIICDFYQKIDKRIQVFHFTENKGVAAARNKGIEAAKGKYIAFVDGDDWVHSDYLFYLYKALKDTNCVLSQCTSECAFDGTNMDMCRVFDEQPDVYDYRAFFKFLCFVLKRDCVTLWSKLYRAELFQNIRFPEGKIHEDEFVIYQLVCEAQKVAVIYSKLYYYRRRQGSITTTFTSDRIDAHVAFNKRAKYFEERGEEDLLKLVEQSHYEWISEIAPIFAYYGYGEIEKKLLEDKKTLEKPVGDEKNKDIIYLFPFSRIPFGSRVILYGAGNVGRQFFHQIVKSSFCQLLGWVDRNATELRQIGYPVKALCELKQMEEQCDYVVIAIANHGVAFEVASNLRNEFGIPDYKIVRFIEELN